jgi:hypothetical protein
MSASYPCIEIQLPEFLTDSDKISIRLKGKLQEQHLLCPNTFPRLLKQITSQFAESKCIHAVALFNAFECASGIYSPYSKLLLRQRLIQLEALLDFSRSITQDLPKILQMGLKTEWFKRVNDELAAPLDALWHACFSSGDEKSAIERDLISRYRLATFFQQSGWLSELSLEIAKNEWLNTENQSQYVLTPLWEQMKKQFVELLTDSVATTIGYSTAEPTRYEPGCAVSEVHHARGVLSYMLCVDERQHMITDLRAVYPSFENSLQIQGLKQDLSFIPVGDDRLDKAILYMLLMNTSYPFKIIEGACFDNSLAARHKA